MKINSTERVMLALVMLIMTGMFFVPWDRLSQESDLAQKDRSEASHFRSGLPRVDSKEPQGTFSSRGTVWSAEATYASGSETLEIELNHAAGTPTGGLDVRASFRSESANLPGVGAWLREQPDGKYRADGLKLGAGNWTLSLTGYRNSRFAFRLEQPLSVTSRSAALAD